MNRRTLLLASLAAPLGLTVVGVSGCDLMPAPLLEIVCDPDLAEVLDRAAKAWPGRRGEFVIHTDISIRALGALMETTQGAAVVTREPKQANRIQRMGVSRLEDRWARDIGEGPVAILVTHGDWLAVRQAKTFAKWLASPAADKAVNGDGPRVRSAV